MSSKKFTEDTTLTAGYTTPYTITLDAGEGTFSYYDNEKGKQINDVKEAEFKTNASGKITSYPKDEEVEPASDKYLFEGWYIDDEKINGYIYNYPFTGDTTVTAHYIAIHTVTFDAGDGLIKYWDSDKGEDVEAKELTYETNNMGRVSNFPSNVIPKEGSNTLFEGWYIGDEEIDSNHVFSKDETVTAHYIPIYTITFNAVDGKIKHWDSDNSEYVEDQKVTYQTNNKGGVDGAPSEYDIIPPADTLFEGWYVGEDKIDYIYDYTFTGDTVVTAGYVPLYTITFDAGEGGLIRHYDSDKGEYVQDQTVTFKTNKYGKLSNYPYDSDVIPATDTLFEGWYVGEDKIDSFYNYTFTGDTEVTAGYVPVYTITFNAVSDSGKGKIITGYDGEGKPIKETTTTRKTNNEFKIGYNYPGSDEVEADSDDYIFKAWSVGGKIVDSMSDYVFSGNTEVTAVYVPAYTITFDAVEGKGLIPTEKGEPVQTLSFKTDGEGKLGWNNYPSDPIASDGKSLFEAWYDEETNTRIENLSYRQFYKNTTLSARYNTTYTITFNAGEGTINSVDDQGQPVKVKEVKFTTNGQQRLNNYPGDNDVNPPTGQFFVGDWYDETGKKVDIYNQVFTGDMTLYAGYTTAYIITLDAGAKGSFTYYDEKGEKVTTKKADLETDRFGGLMFYPSDSDVSSGVEGTVFEGWYDESGNKTRLDGTFDRNMTLTANYVPSFTVTLDAGDKGTFTYTDADGKEVTTSNAKFKTDRNGKLSIYPNDEDVKAAATGSVFSGWYDKETGRKISSLSSRIFSKDTTLTAHFNEIYTVTLDAGEGGKFSYVDETGTRKTDIPKAEIKTDGQGFLLCYPDDTDVLGPEGTVFDAWYHGEVRISSIGDYIFTKDAKVTAQFVPQKTVTLDAAGGKFSYTDEEGNLQKDKETAQIKVGQNGRLVCYPGDSDVKPADETTLFAGWYLNGKKISLSSYRSYTDGATITARYTPVYTVTVKTEDGRFTYYDNETYKYVRNVTEATIKTGADGTLKASSFSVTPASETVFDGWYDKDTGRKISSLSSYTFTSNATVIGKCTPKHSITFKAGAGTFSYNDGNYGWVKDAKEATFLTGDNGRLSNYPSDENVVPEDAGTIFTGWTDGSRTYTSLYYTSFSQNTVLTAVYAPVFNVMLDAKDGTFRYYDNEKGKYIDGVSTATIKTDVNGHVNNVEDPVPADPTMTFEGWYLGSEKISFEYWNNYRFTDDAKVEAHYAKAVKITMDANGGYFYDGSSRQYTKEILIPLGGSAALSQPNYQDDVMEFGGWYTDKTWKTAVNSDEYSPTTDSVVYARWYDTHVVTFAYDEADSRGDEQPIATFYVTHGDTFGGNYYGSNNSVPADPVSTIKGRVFTGWFTDPGCKNRIEKAEILNYLVKEDVTFYAGFDEFYDITFDANGGEFVSKPGQTYTTRVAKGEAIKKNAPTVVSTETEVFEGWFTAQTGGEEIKNIYDYVPTGNQTLYARYTECYVLTFHANMDGATLDGSAEDVKVRVVKGTAYRYGSEGQDKDYLLAAPILDYSGVTTGKLPYLTDRSETQVGWTTNKGGTGNIYFFGRYNHWYYDENNNVNSYPYYGFIPTGDMDFYALWADPISITLDPSGGSFIDNSDYDEDYGKLNDKGQRVKQYPKGIRLRDVWLPSSSYMNPKEGYDGISWGYSDAAATTGIDSYTPLQKDTIVYGRWYKYGSGGGKDPVEYGTVHLHSGEGYFWNRGSRVYDMSYPKTEATATVYVKDVPVLGDPNRAFDRWYTDEDLKPEHALPVQGIVNGDEHYFTLTVADAVTDLYAGYGTAYTVTLDANGGYFDESIDRTKDPDESMRENTLVIESQPMVGAGIDLTGYTISIRRDGDKIFGGWYEDPECTQKATLTAYDTYSEFYTPTKDTTLYASWIDYVKPAATLTASADKTALKVGDTAKLTASAPGVHWYINSISSDSSSSSSYSSHSSDVSPIVLSSDGTVKAQAAGTASVYAELNGRRSPLVEFTVTSGPVEPTMTLDTTELQLASGQTASVTAWVTPAEDASKVKWSTSKAATATVTSEVKNGASVATITAGTTTGKATITATYNTGKKTIKETVEVEVADAIALDQSEISVKFEEGQEKTLKATVSEKYKDNQVDWSCDNDVLTITAGTDPNTVVLKVNTAASITQKTKVIVKAALKDTVFFKECVVYVTPPDTVEAPRAFIESGIESGSEIASGTTTTVKKDTVISLRSYTEGARIFYTNTTDGTAPADPKIEFDAEGNPKAGAGTTAYESSFKITGQLTVKAIAAAKGRITSVPTTYTFTLDKNQWGDIDNEDTTLKTYLKTAFGDDSGNVKDDIWFVFGNAVDGFEKTELTTGTAGHISKVYDGNKILFNDEVIVYYGTNRLIENRDYTLTFTNNTNAAGATAENAPRVRIAGKGNYKVNGIFTFEITQADIDNAVITSEKVVTILDSAKLSSVKPVLTFNGKKLANNTDYTLKYFNDDACTEEITDPKTKKLDPNESYFISISGKGVNFFGEKTEHVEVKTVEKKAKNVVQVNKLTISDPKKLLKVNYDADRYAAEMQTSIQALFEDKAVIVKNGKKELEYGKDYEVHTPDEDDGDFKAYVSAGKHSVIIRGAGVTGDSDTELYYVGDKTFTLEIVGTDLSKAKIAGLFTSIEYTGSEITQTDLFNANDKNLEAAWKEAKLPVLYTVNKTVKTKLTEDTDYKVSMANTGVVGKFNLVYTGINGYTGSIKKVIKVKTHGMSAKANDIKISPIADAVYTKAGAKPKVEVKHGGQILVEGVDYTVTYKNNKKVAKTTDKAAPTATIKGMGNYAGSGMSETFNINPAPVSQVSVVANDVVYKAKGKNGYFIVVPKLYDEGKAVSVGKNKEINPIDKNTAYTYEKLTADGWVEIKKTDAASKVSIGDTIKVTVSLANGVNNPYTKDTDSLVGYYKILADQQHNIAKFKVKVDDPKKLYFNAGEPIVLTNSDLKVFTGTEKNPTKTLTAGVDFEIVSFTNNNKVGNATLVIRGLGEYGGTKTVTLKITQRKK